MRTLNETEDDTYLRRLERTRVRRETRRAALKRRLLELYPSFPDDPDELILQVTKKKKRVGNSVKDLDAALFLSLTSWVRHRYTNYDQLLKGGTGHATSRGIVLEQMKLILKSWRMYPTEAQPKAMLNVNLIWEDDGSLLANGHPIAVVHKWSEDQGWHWIAWMDPEEDFPWGVPYKETKDKPVEEFAEAQLQCETYVKSQLESLGVQIQGALL
jgi:hypothetical protein